MARILAVTQDEALAQNLKGVAPRDYRIDISGDGARIEKALKAADYDVLMVHLKTNGNKGLASLQELRISDSPVPIVAVSEARDPSVVVDAVKAGAFDYLSIPLSTEKFLLTVERALEHRDLKGEINYLRRGQDIVYDFDRIVAVSPVMRDTIDTLQKFAKTDSTILVTGETGTGKSFLSGAVHFNSARRKHPFITINCANIPETLLESELFGHEKGAFTGAGKTRVGRLEQGRNGSVFLDEIAEMTFGLQAKLLRVLEEKSFERVGGNRTIHADVRIIAATNRDLEQQVAEGGFRQDLYYRINVLRIHLPARRERRECIQPLAETLLERLCRSLKKRISGFEDEVMDFFFSYEWPGNIRQLANIIERAVILEESGRIGMDSVFVPQPLPPAAESAACSPVVRPMKHQERDNIINALEQCLWVQKDAARLLGISPRALNYKIRKLGIRHPHWRTNR